MKYQQHKDKKCTCVFFYNCWFIYLSLFDILQTMTVNKHERSTTITLRNVKYEFQIYDCMYLYLKTYIYMCRRWILRWNLRLPIQILRHPMPHDFCKLQSFLKSSKNVQELFSSSRETFYCRDLKNDIVSWICQDGLVSGHLCLSCWKSASFERSLASSIWKQIWKKSKLAVIVNL